MLCASWENVEANAPLLEPEAADEPEADSPGPEMALDDRYLGEVALRVGDC